MQGVSRHDACSCCSTAVQGQQDLHASGASQYGHQSHAHAAPSYAGEGNDEEDVSAYPAAPTSRLPTTATPLGASRPTAVAESNPAEGLKSSGENNVTHAPAKIDRAPAHTNAPQPIAA